MTIRLRALVAVSAWCYVASVAAQTPSPRAADTATSMFDVSGIRVIHRPSSGDIVVANIYLLGGVRQVTRATAGIELFLLEASEQGTRSYSRDRLRRAMTRLGTRVEIDATPDWTSLGIRATRGTLDSTWAIVASRLTEPLLEPSAVELVRQQFTLALTQRQDSPDALVEYLADSAAFDGHPYALPATGTDQSVVNLGAADLKRFHAEQMVKSRMLVVVVGNVTKDHLRRLIAGSLAKLPAGNYSWTPPDTLPRKKAAVVSVARDLPTNYIIGRYGGPRAGTKDYYALRIATAVLSGQLFGEIRSRRNLTYAVDAPFIDRAVSGGGLYVTTGSPQVTVDLMRQQLAAVRTGTVEDAALGRLIQQFITQFFIDNETNTEQADFLAKTFLFEGDVRAVGRFEEQLRAIRPDDIRRVAQRWIRDVQWAYVGDLSKLPKASMERW